MTLQAIRPAHSSEPGLIEPTERAAGPGGSASAPDKEALQNAGVEYRFDLVARNGRLAIAAGDWDGLIFRILESQPARSVTLVGDPPSRIGVVALGTPMTVAPALLADLESLAGTSLIVEPLN